MRTAFANHLVWIPRYRKKVLVGPVEARLKELAEQEVPLAEIATQYGFETLAVEVMPDHVHLFVSAPPSERSSAFAPAEIVRLFKGITSRRLKKEFESLRRQYWGELGMHAAAILWAKGYYVGTAGHRRLRQSRNSRAETIKWYIEESQKK